jgi:L-arabinose isomerase
MIELNTLEVWFVTGSQHLYGDETLARVSEHSGAIARGLDGQARIPVSIVFKPVLTSSDAIRRICLDANAAPNCIGLIAWMHTFSPAKMWIAGLLALSKPLAHLHTQYNRDLPWSAIDMDFMNLNQAAHGDREFGFVGTRLSLNRKVIAGFWQDAEVISELAAWARAAAAWRDAQLSFGEPGPFPITRCPDSSEYSARTAPYGESMRLLQPSASYAKARQSI